MEEKNNLQNLTGEISNKLIESIYLLDVLEELIDGDAKMHILVLQATKNIKSSFEMVEKCRTLISKPI